MASAVALLTLALQTLLQALLILFQVPLSLFRGGVLAESLGLL